MTTIDKPGIYNGFPVEDYFVDPCPEPSLNQSVAKIILDQSPAHARQEHPRLLGPEHLDNEERYTRPMTIGNVVHKLLLGRGKDIRVAEFDDWRKKDARALRDNAILEGFTPILREDYQQAQEMCQCAHAVLSKHEAGVPTGESEVVLAWKEYEFWFRSMIDLLSEDRLTVWDIKTTARVVPPRCVPAMMVEDGWDVQAAMIERGLNVLDPDNAGRRKFRFVTIEQHKPHGIVVSELPESVMTIGRRKLAIAVKKWQECMASKQWPGYPLTVNVPEYPNWALAQWEEREASFENDRH